MIIPNTHITHPFKSLFLTSSPCIEGTGTINPANGFLDQLRHDVIPDARAVFVTATPDNLEKTEWAAYSMKGNLEDAGLMFSSFEILDSRTASDATKLIRNSDFLILGGGHVPTQNDFMQTIRLKELLLSYKGVIMGISAGSMNCASIVYAQPEESGESIDPSYRRFIKGLGVTGIQILPHYNKTRDMILDGKRLFEDITYGDSIGHTFYAIPDGSYFYSNGVTFELRGEGFSISDRKLSYIPPTELTKDPSEVEAPQYPWYEGQGRGMFDEDREETGDETDNFDNIAGVLRY